MKQLLIARFEKWWKKYQGKTFDAHLGEAAKRIAWAAFKAASIVALALGTMACTSSAQTTYTMSWVNQGTNNTIPCTVTYVNLSQPSTYSNFYNLPPSAIGLMVTSINGQTLSTTPAGFGCAPPYTQVPDTGVVFAIHGALGPYDSNVDFPTDTFPPGAPPMGHPFYTTFSGYQAGTNPAFPTADHYGVYTLTTSDYNPWTGTSTQWYKTYKAACGRSVCTFYQAVGGGGSLSVTQ